MTQAEVEALLGGPPGNFGQHDGPGMMTVEAYLAPKGATEKIWCDDKNRFEIYFDAQGVVVGHYKRAGYDQAFAIHREGMLARAWRAVRGFFGF